MKHQEEILQMTCVRWFDYQFAGIRNLLVHCPNGGKRNAIEAARFKAMGTRAGFPDLILLIPKGNISYLAIEMKSDKGKQTENQKEYQKLIESTGGKYVICRCFDEFEREIEQHLNHSIIQ